MTLHMYDEDPVSRSAVHESQTRVIEYIEGTFNKIIEDIQIRPFGRPSLVLKRITGIRSRLSSDASPEGLKVTDKEMTISFPGKNKSEAWRFTCVGKILSEIYAAVKTGEVVTKRDIYYRDPELFRSQNLVGRYVDMIAYTCGVTRFDLNVTASPKGLVAGLHEDGEPYSLIPDKSMEDLFQIINRTACGKDWVWILVVEKEATFKNLVESRIWLGNRTIGRGLLITGKGYPDLVTQRFLRACVDYHASQSLLQRCHQPPVLGLFDCDPDGVKILDVHRNGSRALAHERAYNVPEMKWLGVRPSDVFARGDDYATTIPLTGRDVSKTKSLLVANVESTLGTGLTAESRTALQWMKMLNRKAEIQTLEEVPGGMDQWLIKRIDEELKDM